MKERIGYLVPQFPSQTHAFFWREITAIRKSGSHVQIFSTRPPMGEKCRHHFAERARTETIYLNTIDLISIARSLLNPVGLISALRYILGLSESSLSEKIHVALLLPASCRLSRIYHQLNLNHIHFHSCASSGHIGAMANCLSGVKYSLTLHGDLPVYGKDHKSKTSRAHGVSAVTQPLKRQLLEHTMLQPRQIPVITMGVDTERFRPVRKPVTNCPKIVTIARLIDQKGHRDAFAALKILKERNVQFEYIIAGDGPERHALEDVSIKLGIHDSVNFTGTIGEEHVLQLLSRSDIFLLSSFGLGEAAPVCVMEAMSCGLPVVCSLIGGTGDMITHGKDGVLTPQRDVNSLVQHLGELLVDDSMRAKIGKAARSTALSKFDYRANASRLLQAFSDKPIDDISTVKPSSTTSP